MDVIKIRFAAEFEDLRSDIERTIEDMFRSLNPVFSLTERSWKPSMDMNETPEQIITLAYGMEKALQLFYETLKEQSPDKELQDLFGKLAQVEVRHEQRLFEVYGRVASGGEDLATFESAIVPQTLEGGFNAEEFLAANKSRLQTAIEVLDLAMMLETQALDLYLRFADRSGQPQTREVLYALAGEEKAHLASLGRLLEEKSGQGG